VIQRTQASRNVVREDVAAGPAPAHSHDLGMRTARKTRYIVRVIEEIQNDEVQSRMSLRPIVHSTMSFKTKHALLWGLSFFSVALSLPGPALINKARLELQREVDVKQLEKSSTEDSVEGKGAVLARAVAIVSRLWWIHSSLSCVLITSYTNKDHL
jgi:hypothetical protein